MSFKEKVISNEIGTFVAENICGELVLSTEHNDKSEGFGWELSLPEMGLASHEAITLNLELFDNDCERNDVELTITGNQLQALKKHLNNCNFKKKRKFGFLTDEGMFCIKAKSRKKACKKLAKKLAELREE